MNDELMDYKVAIIGMSGQFPMSRNIAELWENILNKKEAIQFYTKEEMLKSGTMEEVVNDPSHVNASGRLEDIDMFDAEFFQYTPREAQSIDPQQRLFLENSWKALEDAGYSESMDGDSVGVFAAVGENKYTYNIISNSKMYNILGQRLVQIGNEKDYLSTRVSYKLNLTGPSFTVQTASSSSLVSVHLAVQSLLNGECNLALAGGVAVQFFEKHGYLYEKGGIESPDGHCRCFDEDAQGLVMGDGVGVIVLKRLEDAVREKDHIYAVLSGSAMNNDGAKKSGFTAPSVEGQIQAITEAIDMAGVDIEDIHYIEAHGSATNFGDRIEVAALKEVYSERDCNNKCYLSSVKANIGHLDTASGVTGLIKAAMVVNSGIIPPQINFNRPHPQLDLENSPFIITKKPVYWDNSTQKRIAGVSSFGIGGTNVHVIVEEPPKEETEEVEKEWYLLPISAKCNESYEKNCQNLIAYMKKNKNLNLAKAAYTLQTGRKHFWIRGYILCNRAAREDYNIVSESSIRGKNRPVVFLFYGQKINWQKVLKKMYSSDPYFKEILDRCFDVLTVLVSVDLRDNEDRIQAQLSSDGIGFDYRKLELSAQFMIQYAAARFMNRCGINPVSMAGDSVGEYVCGCIAEVFTVEDAIKLMIRQNKEEDYIGLRPPVVPFISSHTNTWIEEDQALSQTYWRNLLATQGNSKDVRKELESSYQPMYITVYSDRMVDSLLQVQDNGEPATVLTIFPDIGNSIYKSFLKCLGDLWLQGYEIKWKELYGDSIPGKVSLPAYAFNKKHYWIDMQVENLFIGHQLGRTRENNRNQCLVIKSGCPDLLLKELGTKEQIILEQGEEFVQNSDISYTLDMQNPKQIKMLLSKLEENRADSENDNPNYQAEDTKKTIAEKMCGILEDLIGIEPISVKDNFLELGGNSVIAIRFAARVKEFNVDITHHQLFEYPTIEELIENLDIEENQSTVELVEEESIFHLVKEEDQEQLKMVLDTEQIESVYPLSFMQTQVLNHMLLNSHLGNAHIQVFTINKELNIKSFQNAWQTVTDNHPILRTGFVWRRLSEAVQFVKKSVEIHINQYDWSEFEEEHKKQKFEEFMQSYQNKFYQIDEVPKMELCVIKMGDASYRFVWIYQDSLFDGWSSSIILSEVWKYYGTPDIKLYHGKTPEYLNYVKWMKDQKIKEAKEFWMQELDGYAFRELTEKENSDVRLVYETGFVEKRLDDSETEKIVEYCKKFHITVNTFIVGVWGIVNAKLENREETMVGIVSSGRRSEIAQVEDIVGLFTNTLPVRIRYDVMNPVEEWFRKLQKKLIDIRKYEYVSLPQISQWGKIPLQNLQTVINSKGLVYTDFIGELNSDEKIIHNQSQGQLYFASRIFVNLEKELSIRIEYDKQRISKRDMNTLLEQISCAAMKLSESESISQSDK